MSKFKVEILAIFCKALNLVMRYRYVFYILCLLPFFIFRDYTPPNELKYISIIDEAIKNGTWFTFYNHGEVYADKPPLYLWLIMLAKLITGSHHIWLIGLFSLLPAIGVLAIMDRWIKDDQEESEYNPLVANMMLLSTILFIGATLVIRMDMLMTFFIVVTLFVFYRTYQNKEKNKRLGRYLIPVLLFLALFTKGPIGILIPVISIIIFLVIKKEIKTIGYYLGWRQWLILIALCVVWFSLIYAEGGNEYLDNILFKQTVGRSVNSFHHKRPIWFYFPRMIWSFAPWSLLFLVLLWQGIKLKMFNTDLKKFFFVIICSSIILLSLISSKLDIYLLPIYPFVIYLFYTLLMKIKNLKSVKVAIYIPVVITILFFPGFVIFKSKMPEIGDYSTFVFIATLIFTVFGIVSLIMMLKNKTLQAINFIGYSVLIGILSTSFILPSINKNIGLEELAKSVQNTVDSDDGNIEYICYNSDAITNMDVFLGKSVHNVHSISELESLLIKEHYIVLIIQNKRLSRELELSEWLKKYKPEWVSQEFSWYFIK